MPGLLVLTFEIILYHSFPQISARRQELETQSHRSRLVSAWQLRKNVKLCQTDPLLWNRVDIPAIARSSALRSLQGRLRLRKEWHPAPSEPRQLVKFPTCRPAAEVDSTTIILL